MEIWITSDNIKELKKKHSFLRNFGIINVKDMIFSLGYLSSDDMDEHSMFILNSEIEKKLNSFSNSRRFYRILFIVEKCDEDLANNILQYSIDNNLKYEIIYMNIDGEFEIVCKSY